MFCTQCGHANGNDSSFCTQCGSPLEEETILATPVEPATAPAATPTAAPAAAPATISTAVPTAAPAAFVPAENKALQVHEEPKQRPKWPVIVAVIIIVVAAIAAIGIIVLSKNSESASVKPSSSISASEPSSSESEPSSAGLTTKASTNDYSWEELSEISAKIADAESDLQATQIAREYNLCNADGKLDGTQKKEIKLSDGQTISAQIIGFRHDVKQDGSKAGISFLADECVALRCMNTNGSSDGGWKQSDLRSWLNSNFVSELPEDLQRAIVHVRKESNVVGMAPYSKEVIGETIDGLWLPSAKELCGDVKWATGKKADAGANDILNAEGDVYSLFQDAEIKDDGKNPILKMPYSGTSTAWWLRSVRSSEPDCFYYVDNNGKPHNYDGRADTKLGVVPGFCI